MNLEFCCPTLFGLEGIVADELRFGGKFTDVRAENGRVFFTGDGNDTSDLGNSESAAVPNVFSFVWQLFRADCV